MRKALHAIAGLLCGVALLSSCATGTDAVATGGTFDFVSPGGQTRIFYDPPADRGTLGTLTGEDLMNEGEMISLDDFAGEVVVLNVWGQWCAPCRSEADDLEQVYQETKDLGVAFLGINVRDNQRDKAQDFMTDQQIGYPSIYDPAMRSLLALGRNYPTSVVPTTIVLDREHRVAAVYLTELLASDLQPVVERIAAEPTEDQ
ncbi:TlpA disulfide reductase family protein [Rhodococcus artemisiae]|uniref:TlpA disulfide reductase family protein n=1 Tax=Rhodococcus artemisiae TaxID=714159 RepID=A0ABU7LDR1_9NOCA|nr:TlpA disulfide reductase family protein [Rhodococcus artemisiae]MEE2059392.1 TlpA disulfide reductase family protein [Rhodococcus artemisiae]